MPGWYQRGRLRTDGSLASLAFISFVQRYGAMAVHDAMRRWVSKEKQQNGASSMCICWWWGQEQLHFKLGLLKPYHDGDSQKAWRLDVHQGLCTRQRRLLLMLFTLLRLCPLIPPLVSVFSFLVGALVLCKPYCIFVNDVTWRPKSCTFAFFFEHRCNLLLWRKVFSNLSIQLPLIMYSSGIL